MALEEGYRAGEVGIKAKTSNWESHNYLNLSPNIYIFDFIQLIHYEPITVWKVSKHRLFSGPHFSVLELNKDIYELNLRIQSKYGKIRTRKIFVLRLVNVNRVIALLQAVTQANQFARGIDRAGNVINFTGNRADKFLFFSRLKGDLLLNFCVCHEKR